MFGILDDIVEGVANVTSNVVSTTVEIASLGTIELDRKNVVALIVAGYSVYELAQAAGVAESVIESMLEE